MNPREQNQSFEAARRQHLIDATIEALADVGFKAASLNQIARRADVSTGLFAHYFGDKDGLLEATLRFMAARLVRATRQRLRAARTPLERLYAVPDSALADQEFERRTSAVWLAFWGQITHSTRYQRIQVIYQRRMISNLRHDLRAMVPASRVEGYATMIASMIDGVWIRSHASPTEADGARARAIVRALIDGLVAATGPTIEGIAPPLRVSAPVAPARANRLVSPVTGDVLGSFVTARRGEIDEAVANAELGVVAWRRMAGADRNAVLRRCAEAIRAAADDLARLDALCTGRAVAQTLAFGHPLAAHAFERVSGLACRPVMERTDLGPTSFGDTRREPIGIVAGFGHWSTPLLDVCRQAAPALALGNAMIFQPSTQAPLTALRIAAIMADAGVPPGAFSILTGDEETTRLLLDHASVFGTTGPHVASSRGATSTKAATIVFADADFAAAAIAVLHGGQRWKTAPDLSENRVYVQTGAMAAFRLHLLANAARLRIGNPLDPTVQIGAPMPGPRLQRVLALIGHALNEGAIVLSGGPEAHTDAPGGVLAPTILPPTILTPTILTPTILEACTDAMPIVRESLFAPVVTLIPFDGDDDVVAKIAGAKSDAPVGVFSADLRRAQRIADRLRARFCCINDSAITARQDEFTWIDDPGLVFETYSRSTRVYCSRDA